jgi:redox-sensitive bicupin YhaK (pirin superfamily)
LQPGRQAWLQVTRGAATLNKTSLAAGDGAAVSKEALLQIESPAESEILLFDLR